MAIAQYVVSPIPQQSENPFHVPSAMKRRVHHV